MFFLKIKVESFYDCTVSYISLPNMDTHVSFLETNCSINAFNQPKLGVPDGHGRVGRLSENLDAVG